MKSREFHVLKLGLRIFLGASAFLLAGESECAQPDPPKSRTIECQGTVKPRRELILRLRPSERVLAVFVTPGAPVKAGDPLAEILDGEAWLRLQELKRMRLDALSSRSELQVTLERLNHLEDEVKTQLGLWKEVEPSSAERRVFMLRDKRDELREQSALLRLRVTDSTNLIGADGLVAPALESQIKKLETQVSSPVITAPFDGQAAYVGVDPTRLAVGEKILELWDTNIIVRAEVLQHQLAHLSKGCRGEVSLAFSENKPAPATVETIEMIPETLPGETHPTFGVRLALNGPAVWLRPGMRISVRLFPEEQTPGSASR